MAIGPQWAHKRDTRWVYAIDLYCFGLAPELFEQLAHLQPERFVIKTHAKSAAVILRVIRSYINDPLVKDQHAYLQVGQITDTGAYFLPLVDQWPAGAVFLVHDLA